MANPLDANVIYTQVNLTSLSVSLFVHLAVCYPWQLSHTVTVEDEEIIAENDLLTVTVTITRANLPEDCKRAPLAHAPNYPFPREDGFWVVLANNNIIIVQEHIMDRSRTVTTKLQFQGPSK